MKLKKIALIALCATFTVVLGGCKSAKPIYLEADAGQIGAGAILFLVDATGTGTLMMKSTPDHPQGVLEDVKLTEKVDFMTAPLWTLATEDGNKKLTFAPSKAGWICQSCGDYKLPSMWHVKRRSN
jgi:hypothetical protein